MAKPKSCAVLVLSFLVHSAAAQEKPAGVVELPIDISVEELQRRFVGALGGEASLSRLTSAVSRGTVEIQGLDQPGQVEMYEKAPNQARTRMVLPGGTEMLEGCDGRTAWEKGPDGVKVLAGAELQDALNNCMFLAYIDLKRTFKEMKIAGKGKQGDVEFYLVDAIRPDGVREVLTIDAKSYLLIMVVAQRMIDGRRVAIPMFVGDYRNVSGVMMPHLLRTKTGDVTITIRLSSIQFNVPVDDTVFARPK